jgi:hypothetical protein
LPNKDKLLSPGMFVRVRLPLGEPYKVLLVPVEAVMTRDGASYVFVVNDKEAIEKRPVVMGQKHDGWRAVTGSLKAEDWVVICRLQALQPGRTVRPQQADLPAPKSAHSTDSALPSVPLPRRRQTGMGILVEAIYPGASAEIVSDTVRGPIEQQVSGMENIRYMRSRCASDGTYTLAISFARGADLKMSQLFVQNRVALAMPVLPDVVKQAGVNVKQGTSGVLLVVNLVSPDSSRDELYLSNYASIQIKDELARVPGVGEVTMLGHGDYSLRVWVDPEKLAARNLSAAELVQAIKKQKETGDVDLEKWSDLILTAGGEGRVVRLRDVAAVELGAGRRQSHAALDGKPVAGLVIHMTGEVRPQALRTALWQRLAEIRARMPEGLDFDNTYDFTANLEARDRRRGTSTCCSISTSRQPPPRRAHCRSWGAARRCCANCAELSTFWPCPRTRSISSAAALASSSD